jgi:hypothetical protein
MTPAADDVPRAAVPADVDAPDQVVWGLTFRQLAILAVAAAAGWALYRAVGHLLPPPVLLVAAVPLAGAAAAVALGRRDGQGLDAWLAAALRFTRTPRLHTPGATAAAPLAHTAAALRPPAVLRLPADTVTAAGLLRIGGISAAVVAAGTVNLGLRTGTEQAALLAGFAGWLNSLSTPAQIVVSTQRLDLAPAARHVEHGAARLPHPALRAAAAGYAAFLDELAAGRDPLRRHVLLVVHGDSHGGAARRGEDTARALAALGLPARRLDGPAVIAALAAAVDPYAPPVPGGRATPDHTITTTTAGSRP